MKTLRRLWQLLRDSLVVNSGYLLGVNVVGALGGLVFWPLATRLYSQVEVGLGSSIISIVTFLAGVANLGLGVGLVRFLANAEEPEKTINTAATVVVLISLAGGGIYLAGIRLWSPSLELLSQRADLAIGFLVFLVMTSLNSLLLMVHVAFRKAQYTFWQVVIVNGSRLILLVLMASWGVLGIVAGGGIGFTLVNGLCLFVFLPMVIRGYQFHPCGSMAVMKTLVPYSAGSYLADMLYRAPVLLVPPLALELLGAEASGQAYVAWMLGWLLTSPGQALASSALAEGSCTPRNLRSILTRAAGYGVLVTIGCSLVAGLGADWWLKIFGKDYAAGAAGLLRWLSAAAPLVALNTVYFSLLRVQNKVGELIALSAIPMVLALVVPALFMARTGLTATGIGWLVGQLLVAAAIARHWLTFKVGFDAGPLKLPESS